MECAWQPKTTEWSELTLTALRTDPIMNLLPGLVSVWASVVSPFCSPFCPSPSFCPFCSSSSGGLKGQVSSMSPSSRAIFSPLKLGFSYSTHLGERAMQRHKVTTSNVWYVLQFFWACVCIKCIDPLWCIEIFFSIIVLESIKTVFTHGEVNHFSSHW